MTDDIEQLRISEDEDARVGHKTHDTAFLGYKTHLAMSEERIITAATVTTGEKTDGKQLQSLIEKSMVAGLEIETVIGDAAYSEKAKFQETEYFKEKSKERYKIEAKNSELKHRHGYDTSKSSGLVGMQMQGAVAIFTVNLKRILKLRG